jgi:hypothetical protein
MRFSFPAVNKIYIRPKNRVPILRNKNFSLTFQNGVEKGSTVWLTVSCSRCLFMQLLTVEFEISWGHISYYSFMQKLLFF